MMAEYRIDNGKTARSGTTLVLAVLAALLFLINIVLMIGHAKCAEDPLSLMCRTALLIVS